MTNVVPMSSSAASPAVKRVPFWQSMRVVKLLYPTRAHWIARVHLQSPKMETYHDIANELTLMDEYGRTKPPDERSQIMFGSGISSAETNKIC